MTRDRRPAGMALLTTLLVVALLTVVVVEFTYSTNVETHLTRNSLAALQGRYLARAGVALGDLALRLDAVAKAGNPPDRPPVETLLDPWALPLPPRPLGDGVGEAGFRIDDESARFNVNSLTPGPGVNAITLEARKTLFQGLLAAIGLDVNLLFPLLDWLDPDDEASVKSGAERDDYQRLSPPYLPRNGRMLTLDELQLVRGFGELTREHWVLLRSLLTALPREDLRINVNTASEGLLTALLAAVDDAPAAKAIVARREQQPFLSVGELNEIPGWRQIPQQVRSCFDVRSQYFTVHGIGVAGAVTRAVAVTVQRSGLRLVVLDWRDEVRTASLTSPGPSDGMTAVRR
ncbi:MAG: type II secretion system minor pseudopilin GspK [Deltaproteobacteria bacterium]|nr:type II secretion system minor pseudopilin GspK [Deltaproteobacteria bacterium]